MEHLEQAGGQSLGSMVRLCSLVFVTLAVDGFMVTHCLENISVDRASALVLFAFGETWPFSVYLVTCIEVYTCILIVLLCFGV